MKHHISVAVRVRPLLPKELAAEKETSRDAFLPAQKAAKKIVSVLDERVVIFGISVLSYNNYHDNI